MVISFEMTTLFLGTFVIEKKYPKVRLLPKWLIRPNFLKIT